MKKLLSIVLCAALLMLMSGCAAEESGSSKEQETESKVISSGSVSSVKENKTEIDTDTLGDQSSISSRVNGSWVYKKNMIDSQNLIIRGDGSFVMTNNSWGEIKEYIYGNYEIISDDGKYQQFCFYGDNDKWYAKLCQTTDDQNESIFDKLEYITEDGEVLYYTGVKFLGPDVMIDENERQTSITQETEDSKPEIIGNFIGKWQDLGMGCHAPDGASRWDVEFRSDGTGTFYFVYKADDIVTVDFNYSTYDTYIGETVDGILIELEDGRNVYYMTTYTWSNQFQKMLMTMYQVNNNGTINLDIYWVYANN